jgi:hypothetical protein
MKRLAFRFFVVLLWGAGCGASAAGERAFADAVAQYQAGRYSAAYGRLTALANEGDVDAARIAIFMYRYGATLYGSHWDASPEELDDWRQLAASGRGRAAPAFQPAPLKARAAPRVLPTQTAQHKRAQLRHAQ